MIKKKICIVTGSRAEYGLLYWLIKAVEADQDLELQLIVTGTHLSFEFGLRSRLPALASEIEVNWPVTISSAFIARLS